MTEHTDSLINWAEELEGIARLLRQRAHNQRPLPDRWRIGQKIRYVTDSDHAWRKGQIAYVVGFPELGCAEAPASENNVLFTSPNPPSRRFAPTYWTSPNDIELVEDVPEK